MGQLAFLTRRPTSAIFGWRLPIRHGFWQSQEYKKQLSKFVFTHARTFSSRSWIKMPHLGVKGVRPSKLPFFFIDLLPGVSSLPAGPSMLAPGPNIQHKHFINLVKKRPLRQFYVKHDHLERNKQTPKSKHPLGNDNYFNIRVILHMLSWVDSINGNCLWKLRCNRSTSLSRESNMWIISNSW